MIRKYSFALVIMLISFTGFRAFAQIPYQYQPNNANSVQTLLYKIDDNQAEYLQQFTILDFDTSFFTQYYGVFSDSLQKTLPRGHYLKARAVSNQIEYSYFSVTPFTLFLPDNNTDLIVHLTDNETKKTITNAVLLIENVPLKFDAKTNAFRLPKSNMKGMLTINYNGERYFTHINKSYYNFPSKKIRSTKKWYRFTPLRQVINMGYWYATLPFDAVKSIRQHRPWGTVGTFQYYARTLKEKMNGEDRSEYDYEQYVYLSKPKFKLGDTLKASIYIRPEQKNTWINKPLVASISTKKKNYILDTIKPKGQSYNVQLLLHDSLGLESDQRYTIYLEDFKGNTYGEIDFPIEMYELRKEVFKIEALSTEHVRGMPFELKFTAKDDNELPVHDAKGSVSVTAMSASNYVHDQSFIPFRLWQQEFKIEDGVHMVRIPDSVFTQANIRYSITAHLKNSENEAGSQNFQYTFLNFKSKIDYRLEQDSIIIELTENGVAVSSIAEITAYDRFWNFQWKKSITLPSKIPLDFLTTYYTVATANEAQTINTASFDDLITCGIFRSADSLNIRVFNPRNIPFQYYIYRANKELQRGNNTQLNYVLNQHNTGDNYYITLNYIWGGELKNVTYEASLAKKTINLNVAHPKVVYPGQESEIEITATDFRNKPLSNVHILSFAFTNKFQNTEFQELPTLSKPLKSKYALNSFKEQRNQNQLTKSGLSFPFWRKHLGLDSMQSYRFLYPSRKIEYIEIPSADSITQIAPYVTLNGTLQSVQVVEINSVPVYFGFLDQVLPYSFEVKQYTQYNQIKIRTNNHLVTIDSLQFKPYFKTIFSVDINNPAKNMTVVAKPDTFSRQERFQFLGYLMVIEAASDGEQVRYLKAPYARTVFAADSRHYYDMVIGPLSASRYHTIVPGAYNIPFKFESGYRYFFKPQFLKMTSLNNPIDLVPQRLKHRLPALDEWLITEDAMLKRNEKQVWTYKQQLKYNNAQDGDAVLQVSLPKSDSASPSNFILTREKDPNFLNIYPGSVDVFQNLGAGSYNVLIIFNNGTYKRVSNLEVKPAGINYYRLNSLERIDSKQMVIIDSLLNKSVSSEKYGYTKDLAEKIQSEVMNQYMQNLYAAGSYAHEGVVLDQDGEPLIGSIVKVLNSQLGTQTDIDGKFSIHIPVGLDDNVRLQIMYSGLETLITPLRTNRIYKLEQGQNVLSEVVITTPYGPPTTKEKYVGAADVIRATTIRGGISGNGFERAIEGAAPGVQASGSADVLRKAISAQQSADGNAPVYIINGKIFSGKLSDLNADIIDKIQMIPADEAMKLYGNRGSYGALAITIKEGMTLPENIKRGLEEPMPVMDESLMVSSLRNNFRDDAFWNTDLQTDKNGKVRFKVTFPDDITAWKTHFLASNSKSYAGHYSSNIQSFKPVVASLNLPHFLTEGDQASVYGKSVNYLPDSFAVTTTYAIDDSVQVNKQGVLSKYITQQLPVTAGKKDSVKVKYQLTKTDGYFDGEEKTIPILRKGVRVSEGAFIPLDIKDTSFSIATPANSDTLYLSADASLLNIVFTEAELIKNYEHLCNEQLSSKIIADLSQMRLNKALGKTIDPKDKKLVQDMVDKLVKRKNTEGLWAWWESGSSIPWISNHVLKALLQAKEAGYYIGTINYDGVLQPLVYHLERDTNLVDVESLKLLQQSGVKIDFEKYISRMERNKRSTDGQKMELLLLRKILGFATDDSLLFKLKKEDIFGNIYWKDTSRYIYQNEIVTTLNALKVLQADSSIAINKNKVINWLLRQRGVQGWRNIYEGSLILEALANEINLKDSTQLKPTLKFAGGLEQEVTKFPFQKQLVPSQAIEVSKTGRAPVYFTWYQQKWDTSSAEVSKNFTLKSYFSGNKDSSNILQFGVPTTLTVEVAVEKDAEFVMIEVPIPAGCTYQNKSKGYNAYEVHREYQYHKTNIFCERLPRGTYTFSINLLPKFNGLYTLNPAKASLMYFPIFYGKSKLKQVKIAED